MLNFNLIILLSLILVYQNILLLNEETLILICFITFFWIAFNNFNNSIFNDLRNRSKLIEQSLTNSLNQLLKNINNSIEVQNNSKNTLLNFKNLGNHFFKLSLAIYNELPIYINYKSEAVYPKKLIFTQRLEQQTAKLLILLLSQKLLKLVNTKNFYSKKIKVSNFICINKIAIYEMFSKI